MNDPEVAETLSPSSYPFGTKRPCLDTNYYETFNKPNVHLVDLRKTPLVELTENGLGTAEQQYEFDAIVFATGFDAVTGALTAIDIPARAGSPCGRSGPRAPGPTSGSPSRASRTCSRSPDRRARRCCPT